MSDNKGNMWPRPKKEEDANRVKAPGYKDYDPKWRSDTKDGKNPKNLNS